LYTQPLNLSNKPCDATGNELVFAPREVDTSASNGGYSNKDINNKVLETPELELFIILAIKEQVRKNNMLVATKIKKKSAKKA
jgi:hypothetical protein